MDIGKKILAVWRKRSDNFLNINQKTVKVTRVIRQVNDHLSDECGSNKFHFISNDNIINQCLWKDELHLNNDGTFRFASNLVDFLNGFIFNGNI